MLIFQIYKELLKINDKKNDNQRWENYMKRVFKKWKIK